MRNNYLGCLYRFKKKKTNKPMNSELKKKKAQTVSPDETSGRAA